MNDKTIYLHTFKKLFKKQFLDHLLLMEMEMRVIFFPIKNFCIKYKYSCKTCGKMISVEIILRSDKAKIKGKFQDKHHFNFMNTS